MRSREHIHVPGNLGEKLTDAITTFVGSLWCIYLHTLWFVLWFIFRLDINLLTLIVSLEAIFLSTLVMISQNRQAMKDRKRDDLEATEVEQGLTLSQQIHAINIQQNEVLAEWHGVKPTIEHIQTIMEVEVLKQSDALAEILEIVKFRSQAIALTSAGDYEPPSPDDEKPPTKKVPRVKTHD